MLTQLRFKNWRSLRDVTIENLTPITVFIGANSSGKTNIVDGLRFMREAVQDNPIQAVGNRGGKERIQTRLLDKELATELEIVFNNEDGFNLGYILGLSFKNPSDLKFSEFLQGITGEFIMKNYYGHTLQFWNKTLQEQFGELSRDELQATLLSAIGKIPIYREFRSTYLFITERWQILDEDFAPPRNTPTGSYGDVTVIERKAENLPTMLLHLMETAPERYVQLQEDLQVLMGHVEKLTTYRDDRETRFYIEEKFEPGRESPTISAGTARLVAMLTAYYALDIGPRANMPGLVVIEEPDTAMNPGLLHRFVDLLRRYVREGNRQFILTTHNPAFLNYFQPEEVRVVSRDENGETTVKAVPSDIRDIWLGDDSEYGLGEVWTTNVFGGLPK